MVLVHVRAVAPLDAFRRHARPHHLRQAVDVDGRQLERGLDRLAQSLRPRLGAEDAGAQVEPRRLGDVVGDRERVARRAAEDLGAEVLEQLRLARRVPAGRRDDRAAEPLGAVVEAEAAGEEPVAVGDVDDRARPGSGRGKRAGAAVRPGGEIVPRVRDDRRLPARARRGVDPDALRERHLQQPERIRVPQLRLDAERQLGQRLELDAEPLSQALALEPLELRPRQRLDLGLEDRHVGDYSLSSKRQFSDQGDGVRTTSMQSREAFVTDSEGMDSCFAERSTLESWRM